MVTKTPKLLIGKWRTEITCVCLGHGKGAKYLSCCDSSEIVSLYYGYGRNVRVVSLVLMGPGPRFQSACLEHSGSHGGWGRSFSSQCMISEMASQ